MDTSNKIVLILTIHDLSIRGAEYYKNLVSYARMVYEQQIDVVVVVNSGLDFNGDTSFHEFDNYCTFGLKDNVQDEVYDEFKCISADKTIISCNRGWDVGPLMVGLKYCEDKYEYVYHVHSKSNYHWNDMLTSIRHLNIIKLGVDTIVSKFYYWPVDSSDDNLKILDDHKELFPTETSTWSYNSGKMFVTKYEFLESLVTNFDEIYSLLTDRHKDDVVWQERMKDESMFEKYFEEYKVDIFNEPIDEDAGKMCKELSAKNYFELREHGYRGIPDLQIEHAIERYIGYLICLNKKIHFSV